MEEKSLREEIETQGVLIRDMHMAIKGQPEYNIPGMVDTLRDHGARLTELEKFKNEQKVAAAKVEWRVFKERLKGFGGGAAVTAGAMTPKEFFVKAWAWLTHWI